MPPVLSFSEAEIEIVGRYFAQFRMISEAGRATLDQLIGRHYSAKTYRKIGRRWTDAHPPIKRPRRLSNGPGIADLNGNTETNAEQFAEQSTAELLDELSKLSAGEKARRLLDQALAELNSRSLDSMQTTELLKIADMASDVLKTQPPDPPVDWRAEITAFGLDPEVVLRETELLFEEALQNKQRAAYERFLYVPQLPAVIEDR